MEGLYLTQLAISMIVQHNKNKQQTIYYSYVSLIKRKIVICFA